MDPGAAIFNLVKNKYEAPYGKVLHKPYFDPLTNQNNIFMTSQTRVENSWVIADAYGFDDLCTFDFYQEFEDFIENPANRPTYNKDITYNKTFCNTDSDCEPIFGTGAICQTRAGGPFPVGQERMCLPGRKYGEFCASLKGGLVEIEKVTIILIVVNKIILN